MGSLEEIIKERERYKELSFQYKKKIAQLNSLIKQLEDQIQIVQEKTRERMTQLKANESRIFEAERKEEQSDDITILKEELNVLCKQTNSYVSLYQKKKENYEKGLKIVKEAFEERLKEIYTIGDDIDKRIKRSKSMPIIFFEEDDDKEEEFEEINDVEIIGEDNDQSHEEDNDQNHEDDDEKKNNTEINQPEKISQTKVIETTRKPPHSLLMFATNYLTEKKDLHLAEGSAFIRSQQKYDGVGIIPLDCPWYICYFMGRPQAHFVCTTQNGPLLLSLTTINDQMAPPGKKGGVMAIYRSKQQEIKKIIPFGLIGKTEKQITVNQLKSIIPLVLQSMEINIKHQFKPFKKAKLEAELKNYETSQGGIDYKFGLLYCKKGQTTEQEMYDNTEDNDTSNEYNEFIKLIGNIIELKGHKGFRAGLDVNSDTTGIKSIYTMFYSSEIMFHVATMLPHVVQDEQKTEKKRHIGNDFCVLIYKEGDDIVDLTSFKSHFNSVFAIVKKIPPELVADHSTQYLVETWRGGDVPEFEPYLPVEGSYIPKEFIREYLLSTMINGQIASYSGSEMKPKMVQARDVCLKNIVSTK
ncbi:hypothetical protein ENUP19_0086G0028 [Entamoeba nuttalli]|uniref:Rap-GAP domain-containing protein n=1 Tax=Entamoeba nuttalli TaxID=412467 RepID=A0ABQ0DGH3_9EUKA